MCSLPGRLIHIIIWPPSRGRTKGRHGGEKRGLSTYPSGHGAGIRRGHNVTAAFEIDVMRTKKESQKHAIYMHESICHFLFVFFFSFVLGERGWVSGIGMGETEVTRMTF